MRKFIAIFLVFCWPWQALAVKPDEVLENKQLEERARTISAGLRCLVCQNQSIDDSDAPLARDLRILVRERLKAGDSDKQVLNYLTTRYGDYILLKPPLNIATILLWVLPFAIFFVALPLIFWRIRKRAAVSASPAPLDDDEKSKIDEILKQKSS